MPHATTERYQGEAGERYHRPKHEIPEQAIPWVARLRAEKFQEYVRNSDTVLEYGVGYGWNLAALNCARKIGFDVSAFLGGEVEKRGIQFLSSTHELAESSIDVVICHHVLEHLISPPEALGEMRRLLKPAGRLLLVVPSEKSSWRDQFDPAEPNHHLYTWTVQTLGNLVSDCGFQVGSAKVAVYGYDRFAATVALRLKAGEFGFRAIRRMLQLLRPLHEVQLQASPAGAKAN